MASRRLTLALAALGAAALAPACSGSAPTHRSTVAQSGAPAHRSPAAAGGAYESASPLAEHDSAAEADRPGLGTRFGEHVHSRVTETPFLRASPAPFAEVAIFYNDHEGVRAQADYRGADLYEVRASTPHGGISVSLTDAHGRILPGFAAAGRTYVVGEDGARYNLEVRNDTGGRYEVVASVDGLDVVDGRSAGLSKRGYVLAPYSTLVIDGFRTSDTSVAAFRFGSVRDSYAARTGDDRNVGVVGLAFFAERGSRWTHDELYRRESADPFPSRYAEPPR